MLSQITGIHIVNWSRERVRIGDDGWATLIALLPVAVIPTQDGRRFRRRHSYPPLCDRGKGRETGRGGKVTDGVDWQQTRRCPESAPSFGWRLSVSRRQGVTGS
jgi:hypothetical protein